MAYPCRGDLEAFLARLTSRSLLTKEEQQAVLDLPCHAAQVRSNADFVHLEQRVDHACLVVAGFVGRFGEERDGKRQIITMHIPGDMCDLHSVVLPLATSALQALSTATIIRVPHHAIRAAAANYPALAEAFWRDCVVDAAILARWVVNLGRRDSKQRIAHLLCEMGVRIAGARTGARDVVFDFPVTQAQLADATGLTAVHVNRTLQALRAHGLIQSSARTVIRVPDWDALASAADFDPNYLSVDMTPQQRVRIAEASGGPNASPHRSVPA
jgi:CRP-like cAMP-binding protein